jgi:hypothetical protein
MRVSELRPCDYDSTSVRDYFLTHLYSRPIRMRFTRHIGDRFFIKHNNYQTIFDNNISNSRIWSWQKNLLVNNRFTSYALNSNKLLFFLIPV